MNNKPPSDQSPDLPPDLAEDLLQSPTRILTRDSNAASGDAAVEERYENAKILFGERMWDEAKRILHETLVSHGSHLPSRQLLEKIQRAELQQLFADETPAKPTARTQPDQIRESLERDLGIEEDPIERLSLLEDLFSNLDQLAHELPASDLHDLGASFVAAGLHGSAVRVLRKTLQAARELETPQGELLHRSASLLLGQAEILSGHPSNAVGWLQPVLQDTELPRVEKIDFFYWMARAQLALGDKEEAARWLQIVDEISPKHRDCDDLKRSLEEG